VEQFWRTKNFRQLAEVWNEKLEASGFDDAELERKGTRTLKQRHTVYLLSTSLERQTTLEYYIRLERLINRTMFPNELEKLIMTKYANGQFITEIARDLKDVDFTFYLKGNGIRSLRRIIACIIQRWHARWQLPYWNQK